jgi:hypothetical protein
MKSKSSKHEKKESASWEAKEPKMGKEKEYKAKAKVKLKKKK